MALKPSHARTAGGERNAKKGKHSSYTTSLTSFNRPTSRRVQAPAPVVDRREDATIAFIKAHADRKDKLLVSSERPHLRVRADAMRSLTVPMSQDGPERKISGVVLDAYLELLRRRQGAERGNNARHVLLLGVEEQDWLQYLGSLPKTDERLTDQDAADVAATAARYLQNDMVFFLVNHREHFFVAVLNFARAEYQVLDSGNYARHNGARFYEEAMSKIRDGVRRCMEVAGHTSPGGGCVWSLASRSRPTSRRAACSRSSGWSCGTGRNWRGVSPWTTCTRSGRSWPRSSSSPS
ncbi:hypothetical protein ZWY2020_006313 [Hordeum vulgare]|nr:hypothetical protein ZWY2020_006313 [Hordeum vulgare]